MRKILFVMVAALAFVACEKDYQSVIEKTDLETVVQNNKVSLKQALLYAENSIKGIFTAIGELMFKEMVIQITPFI